MLCLFADTFTLIQWSGREYNPPVQTSAAAAAAAAQPGVYYEESPLSTLI